MSKAYNVACWLFGIGMIIFGSNKFFDFIPMPKDMPADQIALFTAMGTLKLLLPLVGLAEVVAGILVLFPKTRALGAIIILPVVVGIILHHAVHSPSEIAIALVFAAINFWMIAVNIQKYKPMIQ
jgi:putative oxidoreductase